MKGNEMQHSETSAQGMSGIEQAQALNELRLRIYTAKGGFLALGSTTYMPFIDAQATREGVVLGVDEKVRIRQVINGNLTTDDLSRVELIERALAFQQQAAA